jgi:hypothetical protein
MRHRYQGGCLRLMPRKSGLACWEFLWRENDKNGNRIRRTASEPLDGLDFRKH